MKRRVKPNQLTLIRSPIYEGYNFYVDGRSVGTLVEKNGSCTYTGPKISPGKLRNVTFNATSLEQAETFLLGILRGRLGLDIAEVQETTAGIQSAPFGQHWLDDPVIANTATPQPMQPGTTKVEPLPLSKIITELQKLEMLVTDLRRVITTLDSSQPEAWKKSIRDKVAAIKIRADTLTEL